MVGLGLVLGLLRQGAEGKERKGRVDRWFIQVGGSGGIVWGGGGEVCWKREKDDEGVGSGRLFWFLSGRYSWKA